MKIQAVHVGEAIARGPIRAERRETEVVVGEGFVDLHQAPGGEVPVLWLRVGGHVDGVFQAFVVMGPPNNLDKEAIHDWFVRFTESGGYVSANLADARKRLLEAYRRWMETFFDQTAQIADRAFQAHAVSVGVAP